MEKIDIAVQSYKKPELLFYTLLSIKRHCGDYIDAVWINDDSDDNTVDFYKNGTFIRAPRKTSASRTLGKITTS